MATSGKGNSENNQENRVVIPSEIMKNTVQTFDAAQWRSFQPRNRGGRIQNNFFYMQGNKQVQIGNYNNMGCCNNDDSSSSEDEGPTSNLTIAEKDDLEEIRNSKHEVTNRQLQDLAKNLGSPWRLIMKGLGIPMYKVDQTYEEHHASGMDEVLFQLMLGWRQDAEDPTISKMLQVVERAGLHHLWVHLRSEKE